MDLFSKNAIVVEFNGLPGTGKTTICNEILKALHKEEICATTEYYRNRWDRNAYTTLFSPKYHKLIKSLTDCTENPGDTFKRKLYIVSFAGIYRMICNYLEDRRQQVLLLDQGLIQMIISLFHDKFVDDSSLLMSIWQCIDNISENVISVNCNNKIEDVLHRIQQRPTFDSRLDNMTSDKIRKTLVVQEANFKTVRNSFNSFFQTTNLSIDTSIDPVNNAEFILSSIRRYL